MKINNRRRLSGMTKDANGAAVLSLITLHVPIVTKLVSHSVLLKSVL